MNQRSECNGVVPELSGLYVQFTGKFFRDARPWHFRDRAALLASMGNRVASKGTRGRYLNLIIVGDLEHVALADPVNQRSQHGRWVAEERAKGNHICLVDASGFDLLLQGEPAPCLETAIVDGDIVAFSAPSRRIVEPLMTVLAQSVPPVHDATGIPLDMTHLDEGTAAHHATVELLRAHLTPNPLLSAKGLPPFDAAWRSPNQPGTIFIAEVKSLTGRDQTSQIRLGLGQVLDYAHAVRKMSLPEFDTVRPVLVLQCEPENDRWLNLFESLDVRLTWGPEFPGV